MVASSRSFGDRGLGDVCALIAAATRVRGLSVPISPWQAATNGLQKKTGRSRDAFSELFRRQVALPEADSAGNP